MAYTLERIGAKAERPTKPADFATIGDLITALADKGFRFQAFISTGFAAGTVTDPVSGQQLQVEGGYAHIIARSGGKQLRRLKGSTGTNLIGVVTNDVRSNMQAIESDL